MTSRVEDISMVREYRSVGIHCPAASGPSPTQHLATTPPAHRPLRALIPNTLPFFLFSIHPTLSPFFSIQRAHDVVAGQRTPAPSRRPVLQIRPADVHNLRLRQAPGLADPAPLPPLAGRVDREGKRLVQPRPRLQRRRRTRRVVAGGSVPVLWWWSLSLRWATAAYGAPGDKPVRARASGLRGGPMAEARLARGEVAACTAVAGGDKQILIAAVGREGSGFDSGEVIRLRRHLPPRCRCLMHPPRRAASPPWSQPPHLNFLPFVSSRASRLAVAA